MKYKKQYHDQPNQILNGLFVVFSFLFIFFIYYIYYLPLEKNQQLMMQNSPLIRFEFYKDLPTREMRIEVDYLKGKPKGLLEKTKNDLKDHHTHWKKRASDLTDHFRADELANDISKEMRR